MKNNYIAYEKKFAITSNLEKMKFENESRAQVLTDSCSIREYAHLAVQGEEGKIWTKALQTALLEHEIIEINSSKEPYYIDDTVVIPSNRCIIAYRATIKLVSGCEVLMLRNEHVCDGTHKPIRTNVHDENITIIGGKWEESHTIRGGYGKSGRFAKKECGDVDFFGVSTCMLFNNLEGLTLKNITFSHAAGFGAQMGNVKNAVFENIWFNSCYADGLHFGGNSENILARHIYGEVGDDIFALNAYDWQNSSVTFGPIKNVLCEDVRLAPMSNYKAVRIEPGTYTYDDGSKVVCSITDAIIKNVRGIKTYKMYFQTPPYVIGETPERGEVGYVDNLFFEDIEIDLDAPIDPFGQYCTGDPVRGAFGAFEIGANAGYISFENIMATIHKDEFPLSYLVCLGPKSIVNNGKEVFDPYISSCADTIEFSNITVNGKTTTDIDLLIHKTSFDNVNNDGLSTATAEVENLIVS